MKPTIFLLIPVVFMFSCQNVSDSSEKKTPPPDTLRLQALPVPSAAQGKALASLFDSTGQAHLLLSPARHTGFGFQFRDSAFIGQIALKLPQSQLRASSLKIYADGKFLGEFQAEKPLKIQKKIRTIFFRFAKIQGCKTIRNLSPKPHENYRFSKILPEEKLAFAQMQFTNARGTNYVVEFLPQASENSQLPPDTDNPLLNQLLRKQITNFFPDSAGHYSKISLIFLPENQIFISRKKHDTEDILLLKFRIGKQQWNAVELLARVQHFAPGTFFSALRAKATETTQESLNISPEKIESPLFRGFFYTGLLPSGFVALKELSPGFEYDMRYATANNFTKTKLYDCPECLLRYRVAQALLRAQAIFQSKGLHIKLFDCYRPLSVQRKMWEIFPNRVYVADPNTPNASMHNRGTAVDLTLADSTGKELDMGTGFDFMGQKAWPTYRNLPDTVLKNRQLLISTMDSVGFRNSRSEWWHFSLRGVSFPVTDIPLPCQ